MADTDYASSLPVRSEADGTDGRVHVKIYGNPSGSGAATNEAIVDNDKNVHIEVHGDNPAGGDEVLRLSELGAVNPDGDYDVTNNTKPASVGLIVHDRQASPTEAHQNFRSTGVQGSVLNTVHALDIALHDESGNPYNDANPLPVSFVDSEGTEINDENSSVASIVAAASDTHIYTAAYAMKLSQISGSASSKAKFEVAVDPDGISGYTRKFVLFNSTAEPNVEKILKEQIAVAIGGLIKVTRTNLDNQSQTLYSTISGHTVT